MCQKVIEWILNKVKVSEADVFTAMKKCDTDGDGYYSLGEIYVAIKNIAGKKK